MKALLVGALVAAVVACASTRVTGFTDPDFRGRSYSSVAVFANTNRLEDAVHLEELACRQVRAHRLACERITDLFPPTRAYSMDEVQAALAAKGVEVVLVLTPQEDSSQSHVALYQSFATANAYGNSTSGYGSTVPIRSTSRTSRSSAELIDVQTRRTAWVGDANTSGRGRGTSDAKFRAALAKGAVAAIVRAGHFGMPVGGAQQ